MKPIHSSLLRILSVAMIATAVAAAARSQQTEKGAADGAVRRFVPSSHERLELLDGRVFENAWITAESPLHVTLRHRGGIAQVEKEKLPDEILARYPADHDAAERRTAFEEEALERRIASEAARRERLLYERASKAAAQQDRLDAEAARQNDALASARELAEAEVQHYFRTTWKPGNNSAALTDLSVRITEVEPSPGWPGHWNIKGSAYVEYYMSAGRTFTSNTLRFQGTLKERRNGAPELDLSVR